MVPLIDDGATPVRRLTLNRPQVRNALDAGLLQALADAFARLSFDPDVRCVIIDGAGEKAFGAGADLAAMANMNTEQAAQFSALGHRAFNRIGQAPFPVISAVHGFALGGGLELALACDFIIAAQDARLGLPECSVGVTPGFGGTQRLHRRIGTAAARQLLFTGEIIDAPRALALGLVSEVVPSAELLPRSQQIAALIATRAPLAVAAIKRLMSDADETPLFQGLALEQAAFARSFATADQKEGMAAFLAKRPPQFRGR